MIVEGKDKAERIAKRSQDDKLKKLSKKKRQMIDADEADVQEP